MREKVYIKFLHTILFFLVLCILLLPINVSVASKTCGAPGCNKQTWKSNPYCSVHRCKISVCKGCKQKGSEYCSKHQPKTTPAQTNSKKNSSKKKTNSNKKKRMPDCDDYDSFEDFMDDWDGCMPDGSDAEDYWDNW